MIYTNTRTNSGCYPNLLSIFYLFAVMKIAHNCRGFTSLWM